jgi:hypothetical protein
LTDAEILEEITSPGFGHLWLAYHGRPPHVNVK